VGCLKITLSKSFRFDEAKVRDNQSAAQTQKIASLPKPLTFSPAHILAAALQPQPPAALRSFFQMGVETEKVRVRCRV
jgi:hypothetical protein